MKCCSLVQRISERHKTSFIALMQYLTFGRKYDAAAVTDDLSRAQNKNSLNQRAKIIMIKVFCELNESLSISSHSEEKRTETLEEKCLFSIVRKIRKSDPLNSKVLRCSTTKSSSLSNIVKSSSLSNIVKSSSLSNIVKSSSLSNIVKSSSLSKTVKSSAYHKSSSLSNIVKSSSLSNIGRVLA
ncbi:hypothetical protein AVEN_47415-1 [Araneus ventricosus]|uniref:Uncharacterized protein n=1 Tax=Araneus ventricosus TaxID=182803 RepID=A0A4Y2IVR6_ARAVE|nr:hypothetical protein AVEN_47415-1 [Araneus ventricosus]